MPPSLRLLRPGAKPNPGERLHHKDPQYYCIVCTHDGGFISNMHTTAPRQLPVAFAHAYRQEQVFEVAKGPEAWPLDQGQHVDT